MSWSCVLTRRQGSFEKLGDLPDPSAEAAAPARSRRRLPKALVAMPMDRVVEPPPAALNDADADPASFAPSPFLQDIISLVHDQSEAWPWLFDGTAEGVEDDDDGDGESGDESKGQLRAAHERRVEEAVQRRMKRVSDKLLQEHKRRGKQAKYRAMQAQRQRLPAYQMSDTILGAIRSSQVVVISGETGMATAVGAALRRWSCDGVTTRCLGCRLRQDNAAAAVGA